eukprot:evm.model.scf_3190.1 EVM.evm.TU.scf_3190.1   scf_3190:7344-7664(+)
MEHLLAARPPGEGIVGTVRAHGSRGGLRPCPHVPARDCSDPASRVLRHSRVLPAESQFTVRLAGVVVRMLRPTVETRKEKILAPHVKEWKERERERIQKILAAPRQ